MDLDSPRFVFSKNIQEWIRIILFREFLRTTQFFLSDEVQLYYVECFEHSFEVSL